MDRAELVKKQEAWKNERNFYLQHPELENNNKEF
jgi:Ring finger domain